MGSSSKLWRPTCNPAFTPAGSPLSHNFNASSAGNPPLSGSLLFLHHWSFRTSFVGHKPNLSHVNHPSFPDFWHSGRLLPGVSLPLFLCLNVVLWFLLNSFYFITTLLACFVLVFINVHMLQAYWFKKHTRSKAPSSLELVNGILCSQIQEVRRSITLVYWCTTPLFFRFPIWFFFRSIAISSDKSLQCCSYK